MTVAYTTGRQNNNSQIATRPCAVTSAIIHTDGSNNATLKIFDTASGNNGEKECRYWLVPAASQYGGGNIPYPFKCNNGIYCEVTGGGSYFIDFIDRDINS